MEKKDQDGVAFTDHGSPGMSSGHFGLPDGANRGTEHRCSNSPKTQMKGHMISSTVPMIWPSDIFPIMKLCSISLKASALLAVLFPELLSIFEFLSLKNVFSVPLPMHQKWGNLPPVLEQNQRSLAILADVGSLSITLGAY